MRAVRIHGAGDLRVEVLPDPQVPPGKVLLTGGYTGICGTDLHLYFAPEAFPWDFSAPAQLTGATWPQILGHEFSGEVVGVGKGVDSIRTGDRVAVFPYHYCGTCVACLAGGYMKCPQIAFEGIQGQSGGMAEHKIVDADQCFVLPDGVDLRLGALVEPMAVAWRGVSHARPTPDGGAVVVGGGPIGIGAYVALKAAGVKTVVVSEPSAFRREVLARVGVEHVVDPVTESLVDRVRELTDGLGAEVGIDCAGVPQAFNEALTALRFDGRMIVVASYEAPIELHYSSLAGEKSIRSSAVYTREDFRAVIESMQHGLYPADAGWVEVVGFDDVKGALQDLRNGIGMKVLVKP